MSDTKSPQILAEAATPPLTPDQIAELERLEKAATKGPWYQTGSPWFQDGSGVLAGSPDPHVAPLIVDCESWAGEREEQQRDHPDAELADPDDDAALIAAMRNALPALLAEVRRAREARAEVREALRPFAELANERELGDAYADDYMPLHVGLMNGNVTQSVIRGKLRVADVRRARDVFRALKEKD